MDRDMALQDPAIGPASVRALVAFRGSPDSFCPPEVLARYENGFDRQFSRALSRLLTLQSRPAPRQPVPYHPETPAAAIMMLLTAGLLRAQGGQAGQAQIPKFEVTSVKPRDPKTGARGGGPAPGRLAYNWNPSGRLRQYHRGNLTIFRFARLHL